MAVQDRKVRYRSKMQQDGHPHLAILDEELLDNMEVFELVLLKIARWTLLPEVMLVFGRDHFVKFLDVFKGATFRVPSAEVLHEAARDAVVFSTLSKDRSSDALSYLSKRFDLTKQDLLTIHARVKKWQEQTSPNPPTPLQERPSQSTSATP